MSLFRLSLRDATIQRFEYTFEALWEFLKEYLKERESVICNSPKSCFGELFLLEMITKEETVKRTGVKFHLLYRSHVTGIFGSC